MAALSIPDLQRGVHEWAASQAPKNKQVPAHALPVTKIGFIQSPAYGAANQVVIVTYTVRANWACLIDNLVLGFAGAGPAPNPGDVTWAIDIDRPLGANAGYFEKDYGNVQVPLGAFTDGYPWPVVFRHRNNEVMRVKGITNANVGTGPGNFLTAALIGWEWPEETE